MSIKVVDLQNEEVKEGTPTLEPIEEAKEEEQPELINEVVEEPKEEPKKEPKEEPKEEVKEQPKRQTQKDRINCPRNFKEMSVKSYKYSHEQKCQGKLSENQLRSIQTQDQNKLPNPKQLQNPHQKYITAMKNKKKKKCHNNH